MRGSVIKTSTGYAIRYDIETNDGSRKQKYKSGFKTKKEAEDALTDITNKINKNEYVLPTKKTFIELMEDYYKIHISQKSPGHQRYCRGLIGFHLKPYFGELKLTSLTSKKLDEYYHYKLTTPIEIKKKNGVTYKQRNASSVLKHHRIINAALNKAVIWGEISKNPAQFLEPPKAPKIKKIMPTRDKIQAIFEAISHRRLFIPCFLVLLTGTRRSEVLGFKFGDINREQMCIYMRRTVKRVEGELRVIESGKTEDSLDKISIGPGFLQFVDMLNELYEHESTAFENYNSQGFLCIWPNGELIAPEYCTREFIRVTKKLNIHFTFHDLRHLHSTWGLNSGAQMKYIQERLRHASITTTMDLYSHVTPDVNLETAFKIEEYIEKNMPVQFSCNLIEKGSTDEAAKP